MGKLMLLLITGFWMGLVVGLSFIEAPLKFQAPGMTRELGLGIGHLVFGVLNKIEIGLVILLIMFCSRIVKRIGEGLIGTIVVLFLIVFLQSVFLLPALNERVAIILSGQEVAPSKHHLAYGVLEITKVISLLFIFIKSYKL